MKNMKRLLIFFIGLVMALFCASPSAFSAHSTLTTMKTSSSISDAELVLFLSNNEAGKSDYCIGYEDDDFANTVPESFAIENGVIYVLDTVNGRILVDNKGQKNAIELPGLIRPKHMCIIGNYAYLTDYSTNYLYEVDLISGSIMLFDLPKGITANTVYRIYKGKETEIILFDHNLQSYRFNRELNEWDVSVHVSCYAVNDTECEIGGISEKPIRIYLGKNTIAQFAYYSENQIVIIAYEYVPDVSVIMFEKTVRVYNCEGELSGCTVAENDVYAYPEDEIYVSDDGSVYMMQCLKEGVLITKPYMRAFYNSNIKTITNEAHTLCKECDAVEGTRGDPITSLTRSEVIGRARDCATYSWTFKPSKNGLEREYKIDNTTYHILLPIEERNVTSNKAMTGIPYCRGMHDGPTNFAYKLNHIYNGDDYHTYYTAGNLQSPHCDGSTGLDCSGLACYAYNAPSTYWTTSSFAQNGNGYDIGTVSTSGTELPSHFSNMKQMDFMVRSDSTARHIVLYVSWNSNTYVNIIHSSSSAGKVVEGAYSFSHLKGFKMKSPYSCTLNGCQYTYINNGTKHTGTCTICGYSINENHAYRAVYSHTDVYHFHECIKCGARKDVAYHSFVNMGTTYKCSVCGYETTTPIAPYTTKPIQDCCDSDKNFGFYHNWRDWK